MLICTHGGIQGREFWDMTIGSSERRYNDEEEMVDDLIDELTSVLHRQTRSDVPLGIFLSGGIDSSLIASVAVKKCNFTIDAFTVGFAEKSYNELDNARVVTLKHSTNSGNLRLSGGADFVLANKDATISLIYNGTTWCELTRSTNNA